MMLFKSLVVAAATGTAVAAHRPANVSICDYYTTALLKNNTAANQKTLLTLVVNTAVIGNYTQPNVGIKVAGILAPGEFNGTAVNLLPYFNGGLASTNDGGSTGISQNFLDDGGAAPLMMNMPAHGTSSNQYFLLTHLYEFFGVLLGCSMQGGIEFPAYAGDASLYRVHKFMDLSYAELGYFVTQVAQAAASFGVEADDLNIVGAALRALFGYRCLPPTTVVPAQGPQLQSICTDDTCPLAANATCGLYDGNISEPAVANVTSGNATATSAGGGSATSSSTSKPTNSPSSGAGIAGLSAAVLLGALVALLV